MSGRKEWIVAIFFVVLITGGAILIVDIVWGDTDQPDRIRADTFTDVKVVTLEGAGWDTRLITRFVDPEYDVVCWASNSGIACLPLGEIGGE